MPNLEILKAKKKIGSFTLINDIITIGRAGDNDIVLPDDKLRVSRYHAALLRNRATGGYVIRDLSSLHGVKSPKDYIFQRELCDSDLFNIAEFILKYSAEPADTFKIILTDDPPDLSFPSDVGKQKTSVGKMPEFKGAFIADLSGETKMLFEEFICQMKNSFASENTLWLTIDMLFEVLNMDEDCFGCFAVFEKDGNVKCIFKKGKEMLSSIRLQREVISNIRSGQIYTEGSQLWVPFSVVEATSGFFYFYKGPYARQFHEKEVKVASAISGIAAEMLRSVSNKNVYSEDFIEWPRSMIGNEPILRAIKRIAQLNANVLLLGENGVGKEVAAEEIHRLSSRNENTLRKVNCPAIPKDLVESELFGHRKGAFTGATDDKRGEFELADKGTIFLDEIADLPWDSQRKVLRVIQEKEIKRINDEKKRKVDVRIIAATNRDIQADMEKGRFGSDLFYRFSEKLTIPALRERKKDIPLLAHYFLDEIARNMGMHSRGITPQAMNCLLSYPWPGNVRELRNCIEKALSISRGVIFVQHLPDEVQQRGVAKKQEKTETTKPKSSDDMDKENIMEALKHTRGNKEKAKEVLGIQKQTLYNRMKKYGIPVDFGKD